MLQQKLKKLLRNFGEDTTFLDEMKCGHQDEIYKNIRVIYITMQSMEAKSYLQDYVFRQDGKNLMKMGSIGRVQEQMNFKEGANSSIKI